MIYQTDACLRMFAIKTQDCAGRPGEGQPHDTLERCTKSYFGKKTNQLFFLKLCTDMYCRLYSIQMRPIPFPREQMLNKTKLGNVAFFRARFSLGDDPDVEQHICQVPLILKK